MVEQERNIRYSGEATEIYKKERNCMFKVLGSQSKLLMEEIQAEGKMEEEIERIA